MESTKAAENTEKTKNPSDSLAAMIANINQTMARSDGGRHFLGGKYLEENACRHSITYWCEKTKNHDFSSWWGQRSSGDESADSANSSALLQVTRALQEPAPPKSLSEIEDPSTSFLGNISQDYDAEEKTTEAVTAKLAEFVSKRFSAWWREVQWETWQIWPPIKLW